MRVSAALPVVTVCGGGGGGVAQDDGLGSVELEHHMFEEDDLDIAGYQRLLRREFGAAHAATMERLLPPAKTDEVWSLRQQTSC